ncbi:MAG: flagellin [Actinomycetota bacterium]|jgi:flagellin|nr:flagellin [Actinomycetota bacterium]
MGLQINTNVAALNAYRNLSGTQNAMSTSLERLSSGLRINRAADDAAGLAISETLRGQANGLNQATANAQDAISLIQTAEGGLNESHSILQRMRQLTVQAGNDTNTGAARTAIGAEITQLATELTRISDTTQFNGTKLLDGSASSLVFQVGANAGETLSVTTLATDSDETALAVGGLDVSTSGAVATSLAAIDAAITTISTKRGDLGAVQNRLQHTVNSLAVAAENTTAAESRIRDTDMAKEMTTFTKSQILSQAGVAMLAQANSAPQSVLKLLG